MNMHDLNGDVLEVQAEDGKVYLSGPTKWYNFTPNQARRLAELLGSIANEAEEMKTVKRTD